MSPSRFVLLALLVAWTSFIAWFGARWGAVHARGEIPGRISGNFASEPKQALDWSAHELDQTVVNFKLVSQSNSDGSIVYRDVPPTYPQTAPLIQDAGPDGGPLAVVYYRPDLPGSSTCVAQARSYASSSHEPQRAEDWWIHTLPANGLPRGIGRVDGKLAILFQQPQQVTIEIATSDTPISPADWTAHVVDTAKGLGVMEVAPGLVNNGGGLMCLYNNPMSGWRLADQQGSDPTPSSWKVVSAHFDPRYAPVSSLIQSNAGPVVLYQSPEGTLAISLPHIY